ncbi:propanol-preferring alcohol dehydrogenase [Dongia mobilis]|uniref:alcohol dehydrogenase n=1 Tax=Dongia mobilis TaxID=578943 RepID=A0A4R6WWE5_9PROT|nr:zinc-dependent alcohol dehydrogenase [Dongia mobilis]TDQ86413.1 propanol-preferring alcohol dehydrogenase [Dongia mobilis]
MEGKMKAAIVRKTGTPLKIETLPIPQPKAGEILIKVAACGICHSDVHAVDGDWNPGPNLPLIPGHEVAGHVAAVGAGVKGFRLGDAVGVPWMYSACGHCEFCQAGMETICKAAEATGYSKPGGYAEYMVADAAFVARLPKKADLYQIAPILCAGVTTYRGLKRTKVRPGQWMAVVGIGGLGHIAVQYAVAMGMRVAAVDVDDEKLKLAKKLGAEFTVNAKKADPVAEIQAKLSGTHGAVVTAVATQAFEQAIGMLRPAGTVAYIGLPGGKADQIRTSISAITNWELTVTGSNVGTRLDLNEAVDFALRGAVKAKIQKVRIGQVNSVFNAMRRGKIVGRMVLDMA